MVTRHHWANDLLDADYRPRRMKFPQELNGYVFKTKASHLDGGHVFVDFKKAFDRVWHAALWSTMKLYNINANLIKVIESLYSKATSAVYYNGSVGEWFRTTVGVRQGCLLSPTLFNIFLERIVTDALENHERSVSIGGRTINNLRFADDIDALAGKEDELVKSINIWIRHQQNMAWRSVQKRLN